MIDLNRLQHEILGALRRVALTHSHHGSEKEGYTVIQKRMLGSAKLQFGLLVALLNDWDKHMFFITHPKSALESPSYSPITLNQVRLKKEDIEISKYLFEDVDMALDGLSFNEDVEDYLDGGLAAPQDRQIKLTHKGLVSYYSQFYLKADLADETAKSALSTNKAVQVTATATIRLMWVTVAVVIATLVTPIIAAVIDGQKSRLERQVEEQKEQIMHLQQQLDAKSHH